MFTQIVAGISLLALLWLSARAFKQNMAWGLGVLFLSPIGATLFGLWYWDRERVPYIAYLTSFSATIILMVALFDAWGGWKLVEVRSSTKQALQAGTLTRGDVEAFNKASLTFTRRSGIYYEDESLHRRIKREFDRKAEHEEINARARAMAEQDAADQEYTLQDLYYRQPRKPKERYRLVYKQISVADAHKYIGSTVKVTRKNVQEKEYRLTGATRGSLQFMQKNGKGSFSFAFRKKDIEKIRVLTKEPS